MSDKEKKKPTYEAPIAIPLGEMAQGVGANCKPGTAASGTCGPGPLATSNCKDGTNAPGSCAIGTVGP